MSKVIIKLNIEQFEEDGEEYFVATSDDLEWLVVEWKTIEETINLSRDLSNELIKLKKDNKSLFRIPKIISYPLILELN